MSKTHREIMQEIEDDINSGAEWSCIKTIHPHSVDMVENPPHYNQGGIETIDFMRAYSTKEEFMGHCRLTAIKYLSLLMEKENPLQDAKKARWYLDKLIEELDTTKA